MLAALLGGGFSANIKRNENRTDRTQQKTKMKNKNKTELKSCTVQYGIIIKVYLHGTKTCLAE